MIISKTPFRISFFGGGTDYPAWYREHGGAVLATAIDKYCYINCRWLPPFFEHRSRISYNQIELVQDFEEVRHPAVRETIKYLGITEGVEIHHDADLPARTGLGSSSSFTVGLLNSLYALKKETPDKMRLAMEAIHIEQNLIQENVGSQDQVMAAFGGFNRVEFHPDDGVKIIPVRADDARLAELHQYLMLFFTGFSRTASYIAGRKIREIPNRTRELTEMRDLVDAAQSILESGGDLDQFGHLLNETWLRKRSLARGVTTPYIDYLYEKALAAGASGGKILGAGGGGFLLFFVKPEFRPKVQENLNGLLQVPFEFESDGTQIIYCGEKN